jgi:5-methylcytosine-specific restriction protein A
MPRSAPRPCTAPGCRARVENGSRCERHAIAGWQAKPVARAYDRRRGSASSRGYGGEWPRIRLEVLRPEPLCRNCTEEGLVTVATEVDHIVPLGQGGTHDEANLQPLCHRCHMRKTARDGSRG